MIRRNMFKSMVIKMRAMIGVVLLMQIQVLFAQAPTRDTLYLEDFLTLVREHHPIAKQADLQLNRGEATLLAARGAFDPKVFADVAQKYFDGKQYYNIANGGLKVPTWFGIELTAAYEQTDGIFLNPEKSTPGGGLLYGGISMPIGQGLFIDKRRAELRKAQIYQQSTEVERQVILNELLYQAGSAYWNWFLAHKIMEVYEEALALARQRQEAVKQGAELGDRPSIDTLEAGIQVQNRLLNLQQARLDIANSAALLAVYLWEDGILPLELAETTIPDPISDYLGVSVDERFLNELDTLIGIHPMLQQSRFKIGQLEVDRRMKREQLKPTLNLKYNALNQPIGGNPFVDYSPNNYTFGLEFGFPLLLRKERGNLRLADVKIREAVLDLSNKREQLAFKATASLNDWATTRDQIGLYSQTVQDYLGLLEGERELFNSGESSLFLVNSRELGYIQARVKLMELYTKNQKAILTTKFAFGIL